MNGIKQRIQKLGFTLMEVNLAIFIMATGVLAMISLYPLGYRENQQSRDDVWAACEADRIFNQLHGALSERAIKWDDWKKALTSSELYGEKHQKGKPSGKVGSWENYCKPDKGWVPKDKGTVNGLAAGALTELAKIVATTSSRPTDFGLDTDKHAYAIVVQPGRIRCNGITQLDYSRIAISMRIARNAGTLFAQPVYFTEIHFQGDQEKGGNQQ